ncbi:putative reverse transcriptase domain-containing protein [Tanacetum coccineum]
MLPPEATAGTITQKPYAICDFSKGLFEVGESYSARDSSHVDGLAPWALRHDLEASRARARVMEAELGTCQTEIALLKSKDKIGEKERELLNHDLENVERALGNVLERMSVLENGENATLKKRFAKTETKLVWARMECETVERRLHESRVWNKVFYLDMVRIGAVSKPPSDDEDTERPRKKSKNSTSDGTEGPSEPRGPPKDHAPKAMSEARMREVIREQVAPSMAEFVANMNRGTGGFGACWNKVKFATATLQGRALTWWNGRIDSMGIDVANGTPWTELKGTDIDGYTNRFHELALLCPRMVEPEQVKVEQYIHGLSKNIRGDVTSSKPANIVEAVHIAYQLMGQIIQTRLMKNNLGAAYKLGAGMLSKIESRYWESFGIIIGMIGYHVDAAILCGEKKVLDSPGGSSNWARSKEKLLEDVLLSEIFLSAPILSLPDGSEDCVVYCDASLKGFGVVLMQRENVIAYASRQLRKNEEKLYEPL